MANSQRQGNLSRSFGCQNTTPSPCQRSTKVRSRSPSLPWSRYWARHTNARISVTKASAISHLGLLFDSPWLVFTMEFLHQVRGFIIPHIPRHYRSKSKGQTQEGHLRPSPEDHRDLKCSSSPSYTMAQQPNLLKPLRPNLHNDEQMV